MAPIRPSPTIPSCIGVSCATCSASSSQDESLDGGGEAVVVVRRRDVPRGALHLRCAFPIAIESPEWANMSTSLGMSPIVAISSVRERVALGQELDDAPLFACGWVTSR